MVSDRQNDTARCPSELSLGSVQEIVEADIEAASGEISAAHGLGITREATRQIGGWVGHDVVLLNPPLGRKGA
jgi:hypothetical protein